MVHYTLHYTLIELTDAELGAVSGGGGCCDGGGGSVKQKNEANITTGDIKISGSEFNGGFFNVKQSNDNET